LTVCTVKHLALKTMCTGRGNNNNNNNNNNSNHHNKMTIYKAQ